MTQITSVAMIIIAIHTPITMYTTTIAEFCIIMLVIGDVVSGRLDVDDTEKFVGS